MRVADYIAEHLENIGVKHVFLLAGGGMMHLLDAISRRKELTYICNHHEQASGIAADANARITGKLGVCYATSGPGGTNTLTAVVGAYQDSSPVLFVTGQSKVSQTIEDSKIEGLRQFGTFEADIIQNVKSVTKYAAFVRKAEDIKYHLEKAIYMATNGRPGSVFLDIPIDIQGAPIDPSSLKGFDPSELGPKKHSKFKVINDKIVDQISLGLKKAKKPVLLVGYGVRVAGANKILFDFLERLNVPVVSTCFGKDVISYNHPLFVGHPGMKGDRAGNLAIQNADYIISIGSSLHVTTTGYELDQFAPKAYKVMIDPDEAILEREQVGFQEKIIGDVREFLLALSERFSLEKSIPLFEKWINHCQSIKNDLSVYKEPHKADHEQINIYNFMEILDRHCQENDVIVTDAGSAFYVVGQAFRVKKGQRIINSGSLGAMGFALPAATGAALAANGGRIICITGDGSLQTNIHELAVYRRYNLNIKLFIVNNDGYVCIRNTQNNFFKGHFAGTNYESGVFIPKTEKIAQAYELPYFSENHYSQLETLVKKTLEATGPVICEVFTPPFQEIIPTVSSIRLENGSMKSKPLHEMYPFMDDETIKKYEFKD